MSTNITDRVAQVLLEIDAALAVAEKATKGPWWANDPDCAWHIIMSDAGAVASGTVMGRGCSLESRMPNADFIATSRTLLPVSLRCLKTAIGSMKAIYIASSNEADSGFALKALAAILDTWESAK